MQARGGTAQQEVLTVHWVCWPGRGQWGGVYSGDRNTAGDT